MLCYSVPRYCRQALLTAAIFLLSVITVKAQEIPDYAATMPSFPGGEDALHKFMNDSLRYPSFGASQLWIKHTVYIQFVVDENGHLSDFIRISKPQEPQAGQTEEQIAWMDEEAIRMVRSMPVWNPAQQDGKTVKIRYSLPVRFYSGLRPNSQPASYPGGESALARFMSSRLRYPRKAQQDKLSATVLVSMHISEVGKLSDVKSLQPQGNGFDEAACDLVNKMPDWIPATIDGKNAASNYFLTIRFHTQ
ncbi:energy transducer TonB [Chitinophaga pendula]|uniref:TonB family protein n=1 Tax=Chitinophaga TaxID=79328 RepID=UPI000BB00A14|nr:MULTISPECIES: TonB family protein [Chitinophaga]ASZ14313.1 hypothetical protein CK934_26885 [Chitinophaga sp. MD30]UCJ08037.1 energy transducer TonB [Chitinophaga pendula]